MKISEKLINFQNTSEKEFIEKKSFITIIKYTIAFIIFLASTLVAGLTLPFRLISKIFSKKKTSLKIGHVNKQNIDTILKTEKLILLDFWAEWCGPCVMMSSILTEFATKSNHIYIAKVNADTSRGILNEYKIKGLPQFVLIKNGKELKRHAGPMTVSDLENFCFEKI